MADTVALAASDLLHAGAPAVVVLATRRLARRPWHRQRDHTAMEIHREITRVDGARSLLLDVGPSR